MTKSFFAIVFFLTNMFHIFFWLGLALILGLSYIGETKKIAALFLVCAPLTMFIGLLVMQQGITFDYSYSITQVDANKTTIDYNASAPFTLTSTQDDSIYTIGQVLFYSGIIFVFWAMYRASTWNVQDIKNKYKSEY